MYDSPVHAIEDIVEDPFARQHDADRNMSAGQRLGEKDHVGFDRVVVNRQEFASATDPGLNFVGDEKRPIFPADSATPLR